MRRIRSTPESHVQRQRDEAMGFLSKIVHGLELVGIQLKPNENGTACALVLAPKPRQTGEPQLFVAGHLHGYPDLCEVVQEAVLALAAIRSGMIPRGFVAVEKDRIEETLYSMEPVTYVRDDEEEGEGSMPFPVAPISVKTI